MAFDKDAFLTALDSMSVMELNDLVKAIEEKFGVSAASMAAPAAGGGGAVAAAVEEQTEFNVMLLDAGASEFEVAGVLKTENDGGRVRVTTYVYVVRHLLDPSRKYSESLMLQAQLPSRPRNHRRG